VLAVVSGTKRQISAYLMCHLRVEQVQLHIDTQTVTCPPQGQRLHLPEHSVVKVLAVNDRATLPLIPCTICGTISSKRVAPCASNRHATRAPNSGTWLVHRRSWVGILGLWPAAAHAVAVSAPSKLGASYGVQVPIG